MLKKEARKITGGLSKPSKMPGPAYNLPAQRCITGAKLVKVPGSVCAGCYALKGRYRFKNVQDALNRRLKALEDPRWVEAMVELVTGEKHFRWHDSGDIQSEKHLLNIFEVCKRTPATAHWLPTREARFLCLFFLLVFLVSYILSYKFPYYRIRGSLSSLLVSLLACGPTLPFFYHFVILRLWLVSLGS